ncbi:hypothetical protein ACFYN0_26575 [Streptomyces sp. NPDC006704]|uniref:hypothetical protein n=1 Tax=Streptomyces sp. NPDC006704 TaxID=3364760 RepID=UPI0036D1A67E
MSAKQERGVYALTGSTGSPNFLEEDLGVLANIALWHSDVGMKEHAPLRLKAQCNGHPPQSLTRSVFFDKRAVLLVRVIDRPGVGHEVYPSASPFAPLSAMRFLEHGVGCGKKLKEGLYFLG